MDLNLKGKSAAVTGASAGIGLGIAAELAREGVRLRLAARRKAELHAAAADLRARFGVTVEADPVDLVDRGARDAFAARCAGVDILVNCAGAIPNGGLDDIDEDAWRAAWDLKVFGYIGITRIVYRSMCERGRGVIINVIGSGGITAKASSIAAGVGNAALIHFTRSLGGSSVRHGVRVCGVNPGPVDTERTRALMAFDEARVASRDLAHWRREYFQGMAYGRAASVEEVSGAVAFLASDRASYISGSTLDIEGGLIARCGTRGDRI